MHTNLHVCDTPSCLKWPLNVAVDMPVEESSSSEEEEEEVMIRSHADIMCKGGHSWSRGECHVCSVCGYCTGYGPNCVNTDKYLDPGT